MNLDFMKSLQATVYGVLTGAEHRFSHLLWQHGVKLDWDHVVWDQLVAWLEYGEHCVGYVWPHPVCWNESIMDTYKI